MSRPGTACIIPAYNAREDDVERVLWAAREADLLPLLVWQRHVQNAPHPAPRAIVDLCEWFVDATEPLGKGGAVLYGMHWLDLNDRRRATVVCDADVHGVKPLVLRDLGRIAHLGQWGRVTYDNPGRLSRVIPDLLETWRVQGHTLLGQGGGYLAQMSSYPADLLDVVNLERIPTHYGFDLALALDLIQKWLGDRTGPGLRLVHAGARTNRSGDRAHLARMAHENLDVIMDRSPLWSE